MAQTQVPKLRGKNHQQLLNPQYLETLNNSASLSRPYMVSGSWCWRCWLWFVQLIEDTCCFVHMVHACVFVFVRVCVSSKWGEKGGVESLMSILTGCIHVSLFHPENTCCSGWNTEGQSTLLNKKERKWEQKRVYQAKGDKSGGHSSPVTVQRIIYLKSCSDRPLITYTNCHVYITDSICLLFQYLKRPNAIPRPRWGGGITLIETYCLNEDVSICCLVRTDVWNNWSMQLNYNNRYDSIVTVLES